MTKRYKYHDERMIVTTSLYTTDTVLWLIKL